MDTATATASSRTATAAEIMEIERAITEAERARDEAQIAIDAYREASGHLARADVDLQRAIDENALRIDRIIGHIRNAQDDTELAQASAASARAALREVQTSLTVLGTVVGTTLAGLGILGASTLIVATVGGGTTFIAFGTSAGASAILYSGSISGGLGLFVGGPAAVVLGAIAAISAILGPLVFFAVSGRIKDGAREAKAEVRPAIQTMEDQAQAIEESDFSPTNFQNVANDLIALRDALQGEIDACG